MLLNLSFVFAICFFIEITKTNHLPTNSNPQYAVAKNREELIDIIRSLYNNQNSHINVAEPDIDLNDEEKEKNLQNILWLLNKNYKAQKDFEYLHNNRFHSASRLHFIKNPLTLEEYKNHLKQIRRFSKTNSQKNIDQQNNLKNKLRDMRRDATFRLGSSESYSEDMDKKDESKLTVSNGILPSNNPIAKIRKEKEELQVSKKEKLEEYPEIKDTLELHNIKVHNNLRSDNDFRREKSKWDERPENSNTVEEEIKKKKTYQNQPSYKKKRFKDESENWHKFTTKNYPIKYKKKIIPKQSPYNIRPSYNKPKKDNMNKEIHSYGRTSIPFIGKRGIYDDK